MHDLLKQFGAENDQAHQRIVEFFMDSPKRRVNSAELSLMGFKRWKKGQRIWVAFSPSCIERKARKLAEWGVLNKGYDSSGHAWYEYVGKEPAKPREMSSNIKDGVRTMRYV